MKLIGSALVLVCFLMSQGEAQSAKTAYPSMAPLSQYLMSRDAEISLARSAAPKSISDDAEIFVFTRTGYQMAVKGTNGFVCMVARSLDLVQFETRVGSMPGASLIRMTALFPGRYGKVLERKI